MWDPLGPGIEPVSPALASQTHIDYTTRELLVHLFNAVILVSQCEPRPPVPLGVPSALPSQQQCVHEWLPFTPAARKLLGNTAETI